MAFILMLMLHETEEPGPRAGQRRRHAETAVQIIDMAEHLVATEGLDALTMQRLGRELGYRAGALYRYHASKDALIAALIGRLVDAIAASVASAGEEARQIAADHALPEAEASLVAIVCVLRGYLRIADERPSLMALLGRFLADPAPVVPDGMVLPDVVPAALTTVQRVIAVLAAARTSGALTGGDDAERASIAWNALHGSISTRKMARFGLVDPSRVARTTIAVLLVGFGADPTRVAHAIALTFAQESS